MRTLALVWAALLSLAANAQSWPQKPVRFIVPFAPGGATDIAARMLGEKLAQLWGQSVLIDNRAGAGGALGAAEAARAAADGYTLFFPSGSVMTANQFVYAKLNYDPEKDFVPVTNVVTGPQVLVVPANSPYKTVKDLIDGARANPGKLTFGHAGIGTQTHLAAENFLYQARIDAVSVPYKGEAPALAGLVGGEINFILTNMAAAIPHLQGCRIRGRGDESRERTVGQGRAGAQDPRPVRVDLRQVEEVAKELYIRALKQLPPDIKEGFDRLVKSETDAGAKRMLGTMIKNIAVAEDTNNLLCQDTGIPIYNVWLGRGVEVDGMALKEAIRRGCERATREHPLRSSVVHPITRKNEHSSCGRGVPVINIDFAADAALAIEMVPKGSGSENNSW